MENDNPIKYSGDDPYSGQDPQIGSNITQNIDKGPGYDPIPQPQYGTGYITQHIEQGPKGKIITPPPPPQPPQRLNLWKIATQILLVIVVILAATTLLAYYHIINPPAPGTVAIATSTVAATQAPQLTSTSIATQAPPQATPTSTSARNGTPTALPPTPNNYSAIQPGPGCDSNGGTWTTQGISNIVCGTKVTTSAANARGYLFLQLPNTTTLSPSNKIGVIGNPNPGDGMCIGLDEQDANTGFLAEYCSDGHWAIYTISSDGTIVQTLDKNLTSTRTTEDISLALKGTTLTFSIDSEMHNVNNISPLQPTKVAITYLSTYYANGGVTTNNFSYTKLTS